MPAQEAATEAGSKKAEDTKASDNGAGFTGTYRLLVRGKNINENTLLATDYLNHFNEIIMMLEMIPSMPDCYEDCLEWQPKSYADHFRDSGFSDAELAILAYENAPTNYRQAFDATVEQMDRLIGDAMPQDQSADRPGRGRAAAAWSRGGDPQAAELCRRCLFHHQRQHGHPGSGPDRQGDERLIPAFPA